MRHRPLLATARKERAKVGRARNAIIDLALTTRVHGGNLIPADVTLPMHPRIKISVTKASQLMQPMNGEFIMHAKIPVTKVSQLTQLMQGEFIKHVDKQGNRGYPQR